ncbi:TetR/AcrR family transcriptional regulator [Clostridiaceae bacterium M8S5]|nr:TetR/AcrR family transcriptional regulator [Clostridiaceae bacterium M8S5]
MIDNFKDIDINNEKIKKIVKASLEEFAKFGKDKASLNKILKTAGISKGIFYHYFNDKENLFKFLINYTADICLNAVSSKIDWNDDDIIKRICDVSKYRLEITKDYLFMTGFYDKFSGLIFESSDIDNRDVWREKFYTHNINLQKLKDVSSSKEVIHMVKWTYKGLFINLLNINGKNPDEIAISKLIEECDRYYQVLASHIYK